MDINQYRIFLEVARQQNLSKAAEKLGYTQSGVSHTIRRLEQDMNLTLFSRNRSGAYLTASGKELFPYISHIVKCHENLSQAINGLHSLHQGTLNIGTYSSISRLWLPRIIQRFRKDYPHIVINFKEGGNKDILRWVEQQEADLGFLSADDDIRSESFCEWIPLKEDPLLAVLPPDHPKAHSASMTLEEFNKQTFVISELGIDIDIHRTLKNNNITPDVQFSAKDDYTIISMVACNLGVSILPQLVLEQSNQNVATIPLNPPASRQLGIVITSKEIASPATHKFMEYAIQFIKEECQD